MQTLNSGHKELFCRLPDERFETLGDLENHCRVQQAESGQRWISPSELWARPMAHGKLVLAHNSVDRSDSAATDSARQSDS